MYGIVNFEVFLLTGILLNLIPGTDTMYILSRSISQGRRSGILSVCGILTGSVIHTLLAAFGLSVILTKSVLLFQLVKIVGVIYLVYLGIKMIMAKTAALDQLASVSSERKYGKIYVQGILTSLTNPKVALFFIAFLPQFVSTTHSGPLPFIILGLTFTLTGGVWCMLLAICSSLATDKIRKNPRVSTLLNKLTGIIFIGMGLNLIRAKATP
ncbi:LysE family translocator [Brevibacillus choshinensis]|uniref:LysE family translocator n=1 Tax=Brevibacillus choshinensis TaxID=54911 RepID=UPI002E1B79B5|nr:LysE family translocator [Brevibacillus choshinensis]MED4754796.1 LysE family translocator [Brevibacillus choshinensis]MED4784785.1 LysE family translocator [Brevibacillus choshinensis]